MLSVIGLDVCFDSVKNIDAFDYHLYCNQPIAVNTAKSLLQVIEKSIVLIDGLLITNHLAKADTHLILLDTSSQNSTLHGKLNEHFVSVQHQTSINDALVLAQKTSKR